MTEQVKAWGSVSIEKFKLDNGLKVILANQPDVPIFAYYTYFNVGSRNEKNGKTGIAHFFEHLLFKESKNYKEGEFDRIMEANGASTNAGTWLDWTHFYEVLPADDEKMELVIKLEADRMVNMVLNDQQVNSEREVVKNERRWRVDNDVDGLMSEKLDRLSFDVHPYGQPIIGWMSDIDGLTLNDCIRFYSTYYAPNNATIIIAGKFNPEITKSLIQKYYGPFKSSTIPNDEIPNEPAQQKLKSYVLDRDDIDADKALYTYHVPNYAHPDTPVLELLAEILFNGEGSRLHKQLITQKEIVTSLSASLPHLKDPALFQIGVAMRKNESIQKAELIIFKEIKKIQTEGVSKSELDRAKNRFEMDYYHALETVGSKARTLGHYEVIAGDFKYVLKLMDKYREVGPQDIQRVAQIYMNDHNLSKVIAKPAKAKKKL